MDAETKRNVIAVREIRDIEILDGGGTLAVRFESASDFSDTVVLVPIHVAGPLIAHLKNAEVDALEGREAKLAARQRSTPSHKTATSS